MKTREAATTVGELSRITTTADVYGHVMPAAEAARIARETIE